MTLPSEMPHRRFNPLSGEWVLVSPHRSKRPWQGQVDKPVLAPGLSYDPACYLCPGNERAGGKRNPGYPGTFIFDNDFPALLPENPSGPLDHGLLRAEAVEGICRVVCFSPDHSLSISRLSERALAEVVDTWASETLDLFAKPNIRAVQIFENRGSMMGASNPHPHGQIWATSFVPHILDTEIETQARYFDEHGETMLSRYVGQEWKQAERIVCSNETWVALVPFWAVWPFETIVIPRKPVRTIPELDPGQRAGLADILKRLTSRYDNLFQTPFPYTMGFHQFEANGFCLHAHFYPPLLRSADVRKFMVGFEMMAMPQRDITPEGAAERLREQGESFASGF